MFEMGSRRDSTLRISFIYEQRAGESSLAPFEEKNYILPEEKLHFAVLDDSKLEVPNLLKTNPYIGLTEEEVEKIIKVLLPK